jgi:hypothetical protein
VVNNRYSCALSISQSAVTLHRVAAFCLARSGLFEIARVLVRFDHVARCIVNADDGANADIRHGFWFRCSGSD